MTPTPGSIRFHIEGRGPSNGELFDAFKYAFDHKHLFTVTFTGDLIAEDGSIQHDVTLEASIVGLEYVQKGISPYRHVTVWIDGYEESTGYYWPGPRNGDFYLVPSAKPRHPGSAKPTSE